VPGPRRKEFRTLFILTEAQFKQVRQIVQVKDLSIAWVLQLAVDNYLEMQGAPSPELGG
jgi:hypothetical protein